MSGAGGAAMRSFWQCAEFELPNFEDEAINFIFFSLIFLPCQTFPLLPFVLSDLMKQIC